MPDKAPTMRVQYKKVERQERSRLEAILVDSTKTEADREFARERLQAVREAVVARARVRAARRADYVEPKQAEDKPAEKPGEKAGEDEYPKPTLEGCFGNEAMLRDELELWQIELNDRAARRVLDSPKHSLLHRQNAERTLRKGAARRHEIYPHVYGLDGRRLKTPDPAKPPSAKPDSGKPAAAKLGDSKNEQSLTEWLAAEAKFREEHPEEWAHQRKEWADHVERLANLGGHDHLGNVLDGQGRIIGGPSVLRRTDGSYIATPAQKAAWEKQSHEFARRRGEIVDAPVVPDRSIAYRLVDGFLFWSDNTPCESPLPVGTRIMGASTPPNYHANDNQIPPGLKFNPIAFMWVQDPTAQTTARRI